MLIDISLKSYQNRSKGFSFTLFTTLPCHEDSLDALLNDAAVYLLKVFGYEFVKE
jgi:hypothetical protein